MRTSMGTGGDARLFSRSESHEDRLGLEMDSPEVFNALLDLFFERDDVGRRSVAAIDDGQRMFARDADAAVDQAFAESRMLDQPCGGYFMVSFERRIAGHLQILGRCAVDR